MSCVGSRVKYVGGASFLWGENGTIIDEDFKFAKVKFDIGSSIQVVRKTNLIKINESEENNMGRLERYYAVAGTKEGCYGKKYFYAIYDDGETYKASDKIVVSGANKGVLTIEEILTPEECNANITAEVICKVDTSAYDKRVEERKEKAERKKEADKIKKQMDKMITEMDQTKRYEMYASDNPELAEKLKVYKELLR